LRKTDRPLQDVLRLFCDVALYQALDKGAEGVIALVSGPGRPEPAEKMWTCNWGKPSPSQQADIAAWVYKEVGNAMTSWFPPYEAVAGKVPR